MEVIQLIRLHGLYLIVDPIMPQHKLLGIVKKALKGGVDLLQLWAAKQNKVETLELAKSLLKLSNDYGVPLVINNDLQLAKEVGAHGVHMDGYAIAPREARKTLGEQTIVGYTVGNDLKWVKWAETAGADYISFCAVFPTTTVNQCEIIPLHTLRLAKSTTRIPVFASGGISLDNAFLVLETGVDGIAVVSSILKAPDPEQAAKSFKAIIRKYRSM